MATYAIGCMDQGHGSRRGQPGWAETLGTVELPDGVVPGRQLEGYLCGACAAVVTPARPRKQGLSANQQLAVLSRALHGLLSGTPVSQADRESVRDLASP